MFLVLLATLTQLPSQTAVAARDSSFESADLELSWLRQIRVDREHRLLVPDPATVTLYRLSSDGGTVEKLMRDGAGPGEARDLSSIGFLGDSIVVLDFRLIRLSILAPAGTLVRSERFTDRCATFHPEAILVGGLCLEQLSRGGIVRATDRIDPVPVVVTRRHPAAVDTLFYWSGAHGVMRFDQPDAQIMLYQPFVDATLYGATPGGRGIVVLDRGAATRHDGDSIRVRRWEPGRGWVADRSIRYTPRALPQRVVDSAVSAIAGTKRGGFTLTVDSIRARLYRPRYYPPVSALASGRDGTFWLRMAVAPETDDPPGSAVWMVLDSTLTPRRRVYAPSGLRIYDIDGDLVWGVETSVDEVPVVVRYRVGPGR